MNFQFLCFIQENFLFDSTNIVHHFCCINDSVIFKFKVNVRRSNGTLI